jgi:hypothetical protein
MPIKYLLQSQANQVLEALKAANWNATDFRWETVKSEHHSGKDASRLTHLASNFYFTFDNGGDAFFSEWSPGNETPVTKIQSGNWNNQLEHFTQWLSYLRREVESPDLWAAISGEAEIIDAAASDESNVPFTEEEKSYILSGLSEIKQYLLTAHKLDPELVEARLNYLTLAADRVGRKDWINLLLSVLVNIVIQAALPPDATRDLFRFVGSVLSRILKHQLLLP